MISNTLVLLLALVIEVTPHENLSILIENVLGDDPKPKEVYNKGTEDECICVPFYTCKGETALTNGEDLMDIRSKDLRTGTSINKSNCTEYSDSCCKEPYQNGQINKPEYIPRKGCGQRHPNGVAFKITGQTKEAEFGEFPWMIGLLKQVAADDNSVGLDYQCGGTLIHESLVLTTAHCVTRNMENSLGLTARAGEWDVQRNTEIYPHQDRGVVRAIIHPRYNKRTLWNDFALLVMDDPFTLGGHIDTVCLPESGVVPLSRDCYVSGWGKDKFGKMEQYQHILKKVALPIVTRDQCNSLLRETRLGIFFSLHDSFICAGGNGNDTCTGDGGSPLVCPKAEEPGTYEVSGLVAWGIGCGGVTPGVYASVSYARTWIDRIMKELGFQFISENEIRRCD